MNNLIIRRINYMTSVCLQVQVTFEEGKRRVAIHIMFGSREIEQYQSRLTLRK